MRSQSQRRRLVGQVLLGWLVVAGLGVGLACLAGCQPSAAPQQAEGKAKDQAEGQTETIEAPAPESGESRASADEASLVPVRQGSADAPSSKQQAGAGEQVTADEILEAMVKAYKTARAYADRGEVRVSGQMGDQPIDFSAYFLVAMERPNKIRIQAYRGTAVSDGKKLWAFLDNLPDQVLQADAQPELSLDWLFRDQGLALAMADGFTLPFSWAPLQTVLLLASDPLKTFLHNAEKPRLIEPGKIGVHECYRVEARRPDGTMVFWIDKKTHVLRRFEYPTAGINQSMAGGQIRNFSLVAEFVDAELNGKIDPQAFEFQIPEGARTVDLFLSPDVALLGKPLPEFELAGLDGKPVTSEALRGKVTVLDIWATWCGPCRAGLPMLEKVYQKYKDDDQVAIVAVSVDQPEIEDEQLRKTFEELNVTVPIARDADQQLAQMLSLTSIPAMLLVDAKGILQEYEIGLQSRMDIDLPTKIEKLRAGGNLYEEKLAKFEQQQKDFEAWLRQQVADDCYWNPPPMGIEIPRAEVAERSEPSSLRLEPLWSLEEVQSPGNIVVIRGEGQDPRVLVIDEGKAVVEITPEGKVAKRYALDLPPRGMAGFLRTAKGADGKRWFVCGANGLQQVHLLDENLQHVLDFPQEIPDSDQAGIADAQIGDLDGDGTPELCLGYWGVVGVQGVSLEGKRIWANKSLATVLRVAILDPDAQGKRNVLCTNQRGTLAVLGPDGKSKGEIGLPDYMIHWIVAADLNDDGTSELCALAPTPEGDLTAVGLNLKGELLWLYPLPRGVHERPIEPVSAGRLLPGGSDQWILAAADGSLHFIAADGTLIDRFNYGKTLTGVAALQWGDRHVLLVSTPEGLDAWKVEAGEKP